MSWFVTAKLGTDPRQLSRRIKKIIRSSPFFLRMFDAYNVPMEKLDDVMFRAKKMRGTYATSNSKEIWLNEKLFENGGFYPAHLHFVVHELVHWLTRQREKECYFADPEEVEAFVYGMSWQIEEGRSKEEISRVYLPIIKSQFKEIGNPVELFDKFFDKALLHQSMKS